MTKLGSKSALVRPVPKVGLSWDPPTLDRWLDEEPEHGRWILPGYIVHEGFNLFSGQRKLTNKTYTTRAMALALATGRSIGPFLAERPHKCLFIEEEGAHIENRDAWLAVMRTYQIEKSELSMLEWSFRSLVQLNLDELRQKLIAYVRTHAIEVVFLDALFLMVDGDENHSPVMRQVLLTLQAVRAEGCSIVLIAHLNVHRGADPTVDVDLQVRGSGLLKDAYDLHLAPRRYSPDEKYIRCTVRRRGGAEAK